MFVNIYQFKIYLLVWTVSQIEILFLLTLQMQSSLFNYTCQYNYSAPSNISSCVYMVQYMMLWHLTFYRKRFLTCVIMSQPPYLNAWINFPILNLCVTFVCHVYLYDSLLLNTMLCYGGMINSKCESLKNQYSWQLGYTFCLPLFSIIHHPSWKKKTQRCYGC